VHAVRRELALILALTALALSAGVASADGQTHHYCSGCTINAGLTYKDPNDYSITQDYVHRLSGPSSGVTIGAAAYYTDTGSWGNWVYSTSTEVTHGYGGSRPARGAAGNFGAGNYGFNAHVTF
jgi:hypothetical protein